jgi:DNA mismatch repair protein MutS2
MVVPIDLPLDPDTFIVLITGPNTGGKTVSLKTIGLMALMAQAGLHLPAVEARLTAFNDVFADIGDEQSLEQSLSTFSGHMKNLVHILARVDDRSLVLLDELGSGTDPTEGAALAQAVVNFLRDAGATTFVATHYPELKVYASQTRGATNASLLFDVETLMPTYEMTIGMPGRSNAFAIARRLGLDETILDDALALVGTGSREAESLLETIYSTRERIDAQDAASRVALRQAEEDRDQLRSRLGQIDQEREQLLAQARQQAQEELEEVREEIRELRRKLRDTESLNQLKKLHKQTQQIEEQRMAAVAPADELAQQVRPAAPADRRPRRRPKELRPGDSVLVRPLKTRGEIVSVDREEALVAIGRLHMRTRLEELEFRGREEEEAPPPPLVQRAGPSPGMELDLRGQRVEEALAAVEQYLDAAFLANLPWVRIIHGKGTGRLREAIRDSLKANSHVASWEEGVDGEGGAGVTVVKLTND